MSIFSREESREEWRHRHSQEQIAAGGLPLNAEFRLRRRQENGKLFTSFLSVNELALATSTQIRPLCQVNGSSIFYLGWQPQRRYTSYLYAGISSNCSELVQLSVAQHQVRQFAINRLLLQAKAVGAHGVLGVHLKPVTYDWGRKVIEVVACGTAIAWRGAQPAGTPFVCNLSGQEFRALLDAGYLPVGLTFGTCAMYQHATYMTQAATQRGIFGASGMNQELTDYTQCFYEARRTAMQRLEDQALNISADGILNIGVEKNTQIYEVEVEINDTHQKRNDLIVQFTALGTAVHRYRDNPLPITAIVPLTS